MPKGSDALLEDPAQKLPLTGLVRELADQAADWADAELALTKAEASVLLQRYLAAIVVATAGVAVFLASVVILAQGCVAALLPYVGGQVFANLIVGLALVGLTVLLALQARRLQMRKARPLSLIFRWLAGFPASEKTSK